ncbi:MAG: SIR2 family protein [Candidatus Nanopelagicales bacterium]
MSNLFVIHGDLARIHAHGYVIPTSGSLRPGSRWLPVLLDPTQEPRWETALRAPAARVRPGFDGAGERLLLATDIASGSEDIAHLTGGLEAALAEAAAQFERFTWTDPRDHQDTLRRDRPLLAMPLVGSGRGGFRHAQGRVVREVLRTLDRRLPELPFDVVLVCWTRAQYAAVQSTRRSAGLAQPELSGALAAAIPELAKRAARGSLGVLFGAGVSMPLGLPSWTELLAILAEGHDLGALQDLDPVDAASLIVSRLEPEVFAQRLGEHVTIARHSLAHGLLASLRPAVGVTTNYDRGYELALAHVVGGSTPPMLPWTWPDRPGVPRVLKLHGDVELGSVVLSREHFVEMHALRRPLTALLEEQMLANHVLAVGTSMSDATLVNAIAESAALLASVRPRGTERKVLGTVLMTMAHKARASLLSGSLDVLAANQPPAEGAEPLGVLAAARVTDMFLDALAMNAALELSYLADPAFDDLVVDPRLGEVAVLARSLRAAVDGAGVQGDLSWQPLLEALDGVGATARPRPPEFGRRRSIPTIRSSDAR